MKIVIDQPTDRAINYIARNVRISFIDVPDNATRKSVRKLSILHKVCAFINTRTFKSKPANGIVVVHGTKDNTHYWLDVWINDDLVTIQYDTKS